MAKRSVAIRLSVEEKDTVERALKELGERGQTALRRIESASRPASTGLKAVSAASRDAQGMLQGYAARMGPVGAAMVALGPAGLAAGAGIGLVGAAAVSGARKAMELQTALAEVSTLLSDPGQMGELRKGIDATSLAFGRMPVDQTRAVYQIISAGAANAADAIEILNASNRLAIGGVTDVTTAADALTSVLNAYGRQAKDATEVSDAFFTAIKDGKTNAAQLGASIGGVVPMAAQAHVSIQELLATVAALTKTGQSTSTAMTGVRGILVALLKPTGEAEKLARQLGLEFDFEALRAKGLQGVLEDVIEKTGGSARQMGILFSQTEAANAVMALTSTSGAKALSDGLEHMATNAGASAEALNKMADTAEQRIARLQARYEVVSTRLGEGVVQRAIPGLEVIASYFTWYDRQAEEQQKALDEFLQRTGEKYEPQGPAVPESLAQELAARDAAAKAEADAAVEAERQERERVLKEQLETAQKRKQVDEYLAKMQTSLLGAQADAEIARLREAGDRKLAVEAEIAEETRKIRERYSRDMATLDIAGNTAELSRVRAAQQAEIEQFAQARRAEFDRAEGARRRESEEDLSRITSDVQMRAAQAEIDRLTNQGNERLAWERQYGESLRQLLLEQEDERRRVQEAGSEDDLARVRAAHAQEVAAGMEEYLSAYGVQMDAGRAEIVDRYARQLADLGPVSDEAGRQAAVQLLAAMRRELGVNEDADIVVPWRMAGRTGADSFSTDFKGTVSSTFRAFAEDQDLGDAFSVFGRGLKSSLINAASESFASELTSALIPEGTSWASLGSKGLDAASSFTSSLLGGIRGIFQRRTSHPSLGEDLPSQFAESMNAAVLADEQEFATLGNTIGGHITSGTRTKLVSDASGLLGANNPMASALSAGVVGSSFDPAGTQVGTAVISSLESSLRTQAGGVLGSGNRIGSALNAGVVGATFTPAGATAAGFVSSGLSSRLVTDAATVLGSGNAVGPALRGGVNSAAFTPAGSRAGGFVIEGMQTRMNTNVVGLLGSGNPTSQALDRGINENAFSSVGSRAGGFLTLGLQGRLLSDAGSVLGTGNQIGPAIDAGLIGATFKPAGVHAAGFIGTGLNETLTANASSILGANNAVGPAIRAGVIGSTFTPAGSRAGGYISEGVVNRLTADASSILGQGSTVNQALTRSVSISAFWDVGGTAGGHVSGGLADRLVADAGSILGVDNQVGPALDAGVIGTTFRPAGVTAAGFVSAGLRDQAATDAGTILGTGSQVGSALYQGVQSSAFTPAGATAGAFVADGIEAQLTAEADGVLGPTGTLPRALNEKVGTTRATYNSIGESIGEELGKGIGDKTTNRIHTLFNPEGSIAGALQTSVTNMLQGLALDELIGGELPTELVLGVSIGQGFLSEFAPQGSIFESISDGVGNALHAAVAGAAIGQAIGDDITAERAAIVGALGSAIGTAFADQAGAAIGGTVGSMFAIVYDIFSGDKAEREREADAFRDWQTDIQAFGGMQGFLEHIGGMAGMTGERAYELQTYDAVQSLLEQNLRTTYQMEGDQARMLVGLLAGGGSLTTMGSTDSLDTFEALLSRLQELDLPGINLADLAVEHINTGRSENWVSGPYTGARWLTTGSAGIDIENPTEEQVRLLTEPPAPAGRVGTPMDAYYARFVEQLGGGTISRSFLQDAYHAQDVDFYLLLDRLSKAGVPHVAGTPASIYEAIASGQEKSWMADALRSASGIDVVAARGFAGTVRQPTTFLAGEAGPEDVVVIPQSMRRNINAAAMSDGGRHVEFHFKQEIRALDGTDMETIIRRRIYPMIRQLLYEDSSLGRGLIHQKAIIQG